MNAWNSPWDGGIDAIKRVRETQPAAYLRVIVSVLPKQLEIKNDPFDGISDDELSALLGAVRKTLIRAVLRRLGQWQRGRTHAAAMVPQIGGIGRPGMGQAWAGCGMN